jgi:hypothetical protein
MAKKGYGILLIILFATLVFSMLYPFYTGIREGLGSSLTAVDISNVQQTLNTYTTAVESPDGACAKALTEIKSAKPPPGETDFTVTNTIPMTIQQNEGSTNCTLVDKVAALNSNNESVLKAINTAYGQKYTAVLTMLNTIQQSPAMKSDSNFAMIVNTQLKNPSISGPNSSYNAIDQFIKTASS